MDEDGRSGVTEYQYLCLVVSGVGLLGGVFALLGTNLFYRRSQRRIRTLTGEFDRQSQVMRERYEAIIEQQRLRIDGLTRALSSAVFRSVNGGELPPREPTEPPTDRTEGPAE